jgi:hypothetical protein
MTAEENEERLTKAREVADQFRNFGSALYTYQDYADDFDLSEEDVLEILNNHNNRLSKEEIISKLAELK